MQIPQVNNTLAFGRAFTTQEKQQYKKLIHDSRKALGLEDTSAIIFDFNVPGEKNYDIGIGTTFSDSMSQFSKFVQDMTGITSIQLAPQGKISPDNVSPYKSTNYAIGSHIINLKKLTQKKYVEILMPDDIKQASDKYDGESIQHKYKTDYKNVLGTDVIRGEQEKLLYLAFTNFGFGLSIYEESSERLNVEFQKFKEDNKEWLEPESIFTILTEEYENDNFNDWNDIDKDLYTHKLSDNERQERINEIKRENQELIEYENFKQFLAYKQQHELRSEQNKQGLKLYGDCLLGFSNSEIWRNKDCFNEETLNNDISSRGLDSLDYTKLGKLDKNGDIAELGAAGKLLYNKYCKLFERYDGLKINKQRQLTPQTNNESKKIILSIMNKALKDTMGDKFNPSVQIILDDSYDGNHNNDSLVAIAEDKKKRVFQHNIDTSKLNYSVSEYKNQNQEEKDKENFRISTFSERFTAPKQSFTLPDMFGMKECINNPKNEIGDNWSVRIPSNYEEFYFSQLSKGYGLNTAKALENAFYIKNINNKKLTEKLKEAADILRQSGPNTENDANKLEKDGHLGEKFVYIS